MTKRTEWTRVQLGHLYESTGDIRSAEMHYTIALDERPDYAYALAGMAHVAMANKDYKKAIDYYLKADFFVQDNVFKEELVDVYRLAGDNDKASELAQSVIENLNKNAKAEQTGENIGHYSDRELAYAYLKANDKDKALAHALTEYNRRPDNIDVNETVAWVYYNQNQAGKAIPYIKAALRTNCKNPIFALSCGINFCESRR